MLTKLSPKLGYANPRQPARKTTVAILVHCSATPETADVGAAEINLWHKERGFSKIGYHYVIRRDGSVELGRPVEEIGAHCVDGGMNSKSIGVCLVGGIDANDKRKAEDNYTVAQKSALRDLLLDLKSTFPSVSVIMGHRDVPGVKKACPCFDVKQWCVENNI